MMKSLLIATGLALVTILSSAPTYGDVSVGVYYYGGWSPSNNPWKSDPWTKNGDIKKYRNGELEPMLGWYDLQDINAVNKQLEWMLDYGISFIAFAWYWEADQAWWGGNYPKLQPNAAISSYLKTQNKTRIPYALLWCNHNPSPETISEWDEIIEYWIKAHLWRSEYLRIDGKPVVFIISPEGLKSNGSGRATGFIQQAQAIRLTPAEMLNRARIKAREKGLNGIYFVLCVTADQAEKFVPISGVDAITAYNYHGLSSRRFSELDSGYRNQWDRILSKSKVPYFVPMTSGWDDSPWKGAKNSIYPHNNKSTPNEFEAHLRAGYETIAKNIEKTKGIGMLCCWDEYGEGSIIEPTKQHDFEYLQRIRKVFSNRPATITPAASAGGFDARIPDNTNAQEKSKTDLRRE
jgi:hypothetical protein